MPVSSLPITRQFLLFTFKFLLTYTLLLVGDPKNRAMGII